MIKTGIVSFRGFRGHIIRHHQIETVRYLIVIPDAGARQQDCRKQGNEECSCRGNKCLYVLWSEAPARGDAAVPPTLCEQVAPGFLPPA